METFSALLAICAGNSPVSGEFPAQRPVTRRFDIFFDLHLNKRLSKQSWGWWFETQSRPLRRHCNDNRYLNKWWPFSLMHICVTQPKWVKKLCLKLGFVLVPWLLVAYHRHYSDIGRHSNHQATTLYSWGIGTMTVDSFVKVWTLRAIQYIREYISIFSVGIIATSNHVLGFDFDLGCIVSFI